MNNFVERNSIVRKIWGNTDLVLLVFAGAAAEFALNKAVDWLFFTGELPNDPIGRLFSTVGYAQQIVFVDEQTAQQTLKRINAIHGAVEEKRAQTIPAWAYRDVLYMLIDYSERAFQLLYRPLSVSEQKELFTVFRRVGEGLQIPELPTNYAEWQQDRNLHLSQDLAYSDYTAQLFEQYRRHLGDWRYEILIQVQALLVPERVRKLLRFEPPGWLEYFLPAYALVDWLELQSLVHRILIQPEFLDQVKKLDRSKVSEDR